MRFSVIIPTYNRSEKLEECLKALFSVRYDKTNFEIIVINDGSCDNTEAVLKQLEKKSPVLFRHHSKSNQGQGVARNIGIDLAKGEIIVFIGDDIIVTEDFLEEHDKAHLLHPEVSSAVLGFITWHYKIHVTPLMRFMERGGAILGRFGGNQFAFDLLEGKSQADYRFFYTSNISLKKVLLKRFKFDPWFSGYGWEDIELGYRLTKKAGLNLYYQPSAIAYHDHVINEDQWANRMRDVGSSSVRLHSKYPELAKIPSPRKEMIFGLLGSEVFTKLIKPINKNLYYYGLSKKYYMEGIKQAYNANK